MSHRHAKSAITIGPEKGHRMIEVIFDTETRDPDDFFALCFLSSHPEVVLRALTVNPGTREQIGMIRHVLAKLDLAGLPIGARDPDMQKDALSGFLRELFGDVAPAAPDDLGHVVLSDALRRHAQATVLTGAPLHNLKRLLDNHPEARIGRWVAQGGFAGDSLVAPEDCLEKFAGRETCVTFNFSQYSKGAKAMLASDRIGRRELVSKNVCHGVVYDHDMHERVRPLKDATAGLKLMHEGMDLYLDRTGQGKMFHDPLAACVVVDPTIVTFREVELYSQKGEWGAMAADGSNTFISVAVNEDRFFETLTAH